MDRVEFSYKLKKEDLWSYYCHVLKTYILLAPTFIIIGIIISNYYLVFMAFLFLVLFFIIILLNISKISRSESFSIANHTTIIDRSQLLFKTDISEGSSQLLWNNIYKIAENRKMILVYLRYNKAIMLPKHAMTEEQIALIRGFARSGMDRKRVRI